MQMLYGYLGNRYFLRLLFVVNLFGILYGYYWYNHQLTTTPAVFLPFVPDSPTATLFFVFVLAAFLLGKSWGLVEALALMTLFKYGIWAVVMNLLVLLTSGTLDGIGYMLMASHFAMAVQGLLYAPFYRIKPWHFAVAAIWTLHNDIIDYVFKMMPTYSDLTIYMNEIGYFTFWLSIVSIFICYYLGVRKGRFTLKL